MHWNCGGFDSIFAGEVGTLGFDGLVVYFFVGFGFAFHDGVILMKYSYQIYLCEIDLKIIYDTV